MKKLFTGLIMSCMGLSAVAQNNAIFYGGAGDGETLGGFLPVTMNINDGGNGDGFALGGFLPSVLNINQGGNGDGWNKGGFLPAVTNTNAGGNGDGWALAGFLPPVLNVNAGGNGDGWHFGNVLQPTLNINMGGNGDGWHFEHNVPYISDIYKGGIGDGWSSTYTAVLPLPISFLKFDAVKAGLTSRLNWEMAKDDDVSYFDVERSTDAVNFSVIGQVSRDAALKLKYVYTDLHPMTGNNYYRINIHAINGDAAYTPTRVVNFDDAVETVALKAYPVPAHDFITIEFPPVYLGHNTVINIYSASGVMVKQTKLMPLKGLLMDLNIMELTDGSYYIHVAGQNSSASVKMVKLSR
jgi:hypothetical protein